MELTYIHKLQQLILQNMKVVHECFVRNNIRYYMISGSLLGSVRHGGFIPWDDDFDIAIPRPDYERLIEHSGEILPEYLEFVCGEKNPDYPLQFGKIQDARTTVIEKKFRNDLGGVYIDVFPLDGVPENPLVQKKHLLEFKRHYKRLYLTHRDPYKHGHGLRAIIPLLLRKFVSKRKAHQKMRDFLLSCSYDTSKYISPHRHHTTKIFPKSVYGDPQLLRFEDTEFYGVADPEQYLSLYYGDYMKVPSPENRRQHNFHYINLALPYRQYKSSEQAE